MSKQVKTEDKTAAAITMADTTAALREAVVEVDGQVPSGRKTPSEHFSYTVVADERPSVMLVLEVTTPESRGLPGVVSCSTNCARTEEGEGCEAFADGDTVKVTKTEPHRVLSTLIRLASMGGEVLAAISAINFLLNSSRSDKVVGHGREIRMVIVTAT